MKAFLITMGAVLLGIWAWSKWAPKTKVSTSANSDAPFEGPFIDPKTGAYLPPGAMPGTVAFPNDGVNGLATNSVGAKL